MRVLLVTPLLDKPGGVASYYKALQNHLTEEVEYFTVGARTDDESLVSILVRSLSDCVNFFRKLKRGNYDLVHLNPSLGPKALVRDGMLILIAKALRVRIIVFVHGWDVRCEHLIRKHFLSIFRIVYGKANAFIVLGTEFRDKLIKMGCTDCIFLEKTIVEDEFFLRSTALRRQWSNGGEGKKLNILALTRIEKTKGVYEAVDAYCILKRKFPWITLTIAGDGPELQAVKQYVHDMKTSDVDFLGHVQGEQKHTTFEHADIYLFPTSYGEGMPIAILEAMAYSLPVVTRPVGGIRDYFENGHMGFITESLDPNVFAGLLETLIVDNALRLTIGAFNRDYAREHFTAKKAAGRLQGIYRKVLANASDR